MNVSSSAYHYRIFGMDCSKDAARIEDAARGAGAEGVHVSVATHRMTFDARPETVSDIEQAVGTRGFGVERIDGSEAPSLTHESPAYRRALWIVVLLNLGYGAVETAGGLLAGSQALKADALDFLGDGLITLLAVVAIGWSIAWRARAALIQGTFLGLLGIGVLITTVYRIFFQAMPTAELMGAFGIGALIVNVLSVLPLLPHRKGDANMRAVWLFSRNDAIGNVAVVIAAALVAWSGSPWPDLIVALAIAGLFLHSSWNVIRDARSDMRAD